MASENNVQISWYSDIFKILDKEIAEMEEKYGLNDEFDNEHDKSKR